MTIRIQALRGACGKTCLIVSDISNPKTAAFGAELKSIGHQAGLTNPVEVVSTSPIQTHLSGPEDLGMVAMVPYLLEDDKSAILVPDVWGEDAEFSRSDWRSEVAGENTSLGYWEWIEHRREEEHRSPAGIARESPGGKFMNATLFDQANPGKFVNAKVAVSRHWIEVFVDGFSAPDSEDSSPIAVELYEGHLRAILFPDLNDEDPTIINFDRARANNLGQEQ